MPVYTGDKFGFGKGPSGSDGAPASAGEAFFPEPGQFDWVCPAGVTSVCAVCIGGGGGSTRDEMGGSGGGGLGYKNNIAVTPGETYKIQVGAGGAGDVYMNRYGCSGGDSWFINATTVKGGGGGGTGCAADGDHTLPGYGGRGGTYVGDGGGNGGNGGDGNRSSISGTGADTGGGGAGGYGGDGGQGGDYNGNWNSGTDGNGGGGGGAATAAGGSNEYWGGGGGGVSVYGKGRNGTTGSNQNYSWCGGGYGGSGGSQGWGNPGDTNGYAQVNGGQYGGGGGSTDQRGGIGASGAVRLIWGTGREFPSNGADDFWSETITRYTASSAGDITTISSNWFRGGLGEEDNGNYSSNYNYNGIVPNVSGHDNLDSDFTIECWIYVERLVDNTQTFGSGTDGWGAVIMDGRTLQSSSANQLGSWWISRGDTRRGSTGPYFINYSVQGGGGMTSDTECIEQCTWHHVAITRQNNTYWMWVDGVKVKSAGEQGPGGTGGTPTTILAHSDRPVIGGWGYGGRMHYWSWYGNISNFRITKGLALYDDSGTTYTVPTFPLTTTVPAGGSAQCLCCGVDNDYEKDLVNARVWSGPNCMPSALGPGQPTEDIVKKGYRIWGRHRGLGGGTQNGQNGSAGDGGLLSTWKKSTGSFQTEQFSTHGGWSTSATNADGIAIKVMPGGAYATGDNAGAKWNLRSIAYGMPSHRPRKNTLGNGPFIENVHIKVMGGKNTGDTVIYDSGQFTLRIPSYNDYNSNGGTPSKERYTSGAFEIVLPNGGANDLDMDTWYSVYLKGMEHPNVNDWNSSNGTPGANKQNYWYSEQPVSYSANSGSYNEMRYAPSTSGDSDAIVIRLEQANFNDTSWANNNHGSFNPLGQSPFFGISMPINFMKDPIPSGGGGGGGGATKGTESNPAINAKEMYDLGERTNGYYWIKGNGAISAARQIYCIMDDTWGSWSGDSTGGWMVIANHDAQKQPNQGHQARPTSNASYVGSDDGAGNPATSSMIPEKSFSVNMQDIPFTKVMQFVYTQSGGSMPQSVNWLTNNPHCYWCSRFNSEQTIPTDGAWILVFDDKGLVLSWAGSQLLKRHLYNNNDENCEAFGCMNSSGQSPVSRNGSGGNQSDPVYIATWAHSSNTNNYETISWCDTGTDGYDDWQDGSGQSDQWYVEGQGGKGTAQGKPSMIVVQ